MFGGGCHRGCWLAAAAWGFNSREAVEAAANS